MKHLIALVALVLSLTSLSAQQYPFNNIRLGNEERLDNLLSLMTLDEKIMCLSTRPSVPRLGIKGTRIIEGLHGLALSGPANWAVRGKGASVTTTFPQAYGMAQMWDPDLLLKAAALEAEEARRRRTADPEAEDGDGGEGRGTAGAGWLWLGGRGGGARRRADWDRSRASASASRISAALP